MIQEDARAAELRRRYRAEWYAVDGLLTAIGQMVKEDFPAPDGGLPTRYHVDALRALAGSLSALVEGYERQENGFTAARR